MVKRIFLVLTIALATLAGQLLYAQTQSGTRGQSIKVTVLDSLTKTPIEFATLSATAEGAEKPSLRSDSIEKTFSPKSL